MKLLFIILVWLYCIAIVASNEYPNNGNPLVDGVVLKRYIVIYPYVDGKTCLNNCSNAFLNCIRYLPRLRRYGWVFGMRCSIERRYCAVECKGKR